ncbi:MAG: dienelactone hydrolase family protein [Ignavibacteriales bacterium]|nr:dienelactone hydrolase family protein [Ignavibacteriales bacterium]
MFVVKFRYVSVVQEINTSLSYKIKTPSQKSTFHPTLLLLHGRGADENDLLGLGEYLDPRLLIISARAPFRFPDGGYTWYELLEVGKPELAQFNESYERLVLFLGEVRKEFAVDPGNIYLLGFSMGSMMAYALTLSRPDEIKGMIAHSGYIPEEPGHNYRWDRLSETAFFVAHGTLDPVIPVQLGRRSHELLSKVKTDLTYREYPIGHHISEESLQDLSTWLKQQLTKIED